MSTDTARSVMAFALALLAFSWLPSARAAEVPEAVLQAEQGRVRTMEESAPAVVAIFAAGGQGGGSGVLIDAQGFTVTNFHVVQGLGGFMKCGLNDGRIYDAVLVGLDPTGDLALIQMLGRGDFPHARIGDSDQVRVGDCVFAMGNPFLLATDFQPTVTSGMVSGVHRYQYPAGTFLEYTDCLQVDASINPGNSGGPLFNCQGELIGINGRISVEKRGRVNVGAGYAISINQVMNFLDHLKSGRIVDHATLGATVTATSDGTVVIANILESSDAYRRGLRRDDELVSFAGRPIRSVNQFKNILGIYPKGWTVPLSYRRDGQRQDIQVRLMALHRQAELAGGERLEPELPEPPQPGPDEDGPRQPPRLPHGGPPAPQVEVPEEYADLYEEKTGFANYHFNEQAQQRLMQQLEEFGDYSGVPAAWRIRGMMEQGEAVDIRLLPTGLAARIGEQLSAQDPEEDYQDLPPGSGGLLAALEQFQHLLMNPREYFTEFYYVGSEPLQGSAERFDVLVTTRGLLTSRWYFDREEGGLIAFETTREEGVDGCGVRVEGRIDVGGGRKFPAMMEITSGGRLFGRLKIESVDFAAPSPEKGGATQ